MPNLATVQLKQDVAPKFWDDTLVEAINFSWPDSSLNAYEQGEGTGTIVIEGPPEAATMVAERLEAFIIFLQNQGFNCYLVVNLWIVVDTDKGGGMLVPLGGVIYEDPAEVLACYDKAVAEILAGDNSGQEIQIFELHNINPDELR